MVSFLEVTPQKVRIPPPWGAKPASNFFPDKKMANTVKDHWRGI
jgi:hypothetical protein